MTGVVVPWNYLMIMAAWKWVSRAGGPANSVVLAEREEPADRPTPGRDRRRGRPARGVFNVVWATGHEVGEVLVLHMDVDAIGFTGSTRVGRRDARLRRTQQPEACLQRAGGKSASSSTTLNVARAAKTVAGSMFFNQGELQRAVAGWCTSARRRLLRSSQPRCRSTHRRPAVRHRSRWGAGRRDADEDRPRLHRRRRGEGARVVTGGPPGARRRPADSSCGRRCSTA